MIVPRTQRRVPALTFPPLELFIQALHTPKYQWLLLSLDCSLCSFHEGNMGSKHFPTGSEYGRALDIQNSYLSLQASYTRMIDHNAGKV